MESQKILIYGPSHTGKTTFVKKVNGIENNLIVRNPSEFPTIYVSNELPNEEILNEFDIILNFTKNKEVIFEKGIEKIARS